MDFDFQTFVTEWQLTKEATKILQSENYATKSALLGLSRGDLNNL